MGKDLILSSKNISSDSTLDSPKWNIDSRIMPSGKLSIKKISYTNYQNTDWILMDHIPPQSGSGSTSWFARNDSLGFTGVSQSAIGVESDLTQYFRRAGTFEGAVPGYNQIKIQTVNGSFEGSANRAFWIFSKQTRDAFGRQSEAGENGTLTVGGDSNFLFNKFPLIDSWDFTSSEQAKSFYVDPNFVSSQPASGPFIVSHQHVGGNIQCFYLENGNGGTANANTSVGNLLYYGMQIWIRRYVPRYNPYAIIHQTGADIRRDYMTGDSFTNPLIKFMYFQLFNPDIAGVSMNITEVRLLNTASNNVLRDSSVVIPTDNNNSLAVETNPSASQIKVNDTLIDIIDDSILSNAIIGIPNDEGDDIIQFKLNRSYMFDEFNRMEIYFSHESGPLQIRFLDHNYKIVHTSVFYTSKPSFAQTNESLIILKMLGPNPLIGFNNNVNDDVATYVLSWADELVLSSSYIYRKVEEIPYNLGIGGSKELIKGPSRSLSLAAQIRATTGPYTDFNIPSISDDPSDTPYGWKLVDHIPEGDTGNWWSREDDLGYRTDNPPSAIGSITDLSNRFRLPGTMESNCPGYDQILLKTIKRYDGSLGHTAGDLYYVFSRTERDRVAQADGSLNIALLASYDGDTALFVQMIQTGGPSRPYISFPAYSDTRVIYQENGDAGRKAMVPFGLQIWIRNSKYNNVVAKGSYEPDKSIKPVKWENTGEVSFKFKNINSNETVQEDQMPKSYNLHCHICDCDK